MYPKKLLYLYLLVPVFTNSLYGQNPPENNDAMPDVSEFRQNIPFSDPYKSLPPNPIPRKIQVTGQEEQNVHIETSDAIDHMMELHRNLARPVSNKGFRVQIYTGNNTGASNAKLQFITMYDDIDVYTIFEQPMFKVRIGNFKTQKEADEFCKDIKYAFPASFVVPDTIEIQPDDSPVNE